MEKDPMKMIEGRPKQTPAGCVFQLIFLAAVLWIMYMFARPGGWQGEFDIENYKPDKLMAYNMAESFVEQDLKSPSSAEFPGPSTKQAHTTFNGGTSYTIRSYVDAQNSFGANVRTYWAAIIMEDAEGWKLLGLKFSDTPITD